MKRNIHKLLSLSVMVFCSANFIHAQVSITGTGTVYSQSFDGFISSGSSTWSDNSTLSNWYADKSGSGTLNIAADNGSSSTVSLYSYGATSSGDRAFGALPGTTGNGNLMVGLRMKNNTGFDIERMDDASGEFVKIAFVEGAGNSASAQSYSYMDACLANKAYYRIRQVDFNGEAHYSKVLLAERKEDKTIAFYPNPVSERLVMQWGSDEVLGSSIKLYDLFGKEYQVPALQLSPNSIQLDVSSLKRGGYMLSWVSGNQVNTKKILMN